LKKPTISTLLKLHRLVYTGPSDNVTIANFLFSGASVTRHDFATIPGRADLADARLLILTVQRKGDTETVAQNRQRLQTRLSTITSELLNEKGYIAFVDIFMQLGHLSPSDYEYWRLRRIPYLERVITLNRGQINLVLKTVRRNSLHGKLTPSLTVYKSWGKGKKELLRFSASDESALEEAYATHFVKPQASI
jgi:hypothetical protein